MRPAAPAAGTQWGDFAGSAEDAIAEDPSTLMAETQWGDFAGGADGETGEDPITLQPLQPGHTVFIVSPDGSTKMSYNISTLRQIAESKGTWMQPPHFREPMQPDLKARIEILEPATAGPLAVQPRHAEMSDLDRDLWEEFGYGGGNRIVVAYGRRHQQLLERHWGLGHVSQKKIYVCGYCWKTAVEATHAEGDSDASAGGRRMLRREAYLSRPAPSSSASQAREVSGGPEPSGSPMRSTSASSDERSVVARNAPERAAAERSVVAGNAPERAAAERSVVAGSASERAAAERSVVAGNAPERAAAERSVVAGSAPEQAGVGPDYPEQAGGEPVPALDAGTVPQRSLGPVKTPPVPDARTPASQEPLQCGPAYAIPDTPPPRVVRPAAGRAGPNPGASRCLFTPRARSQQSGNPQPQQVPGCQRQWSQQLACNLQLQRTQQLAGNLQLQRTQQLPGNLQPASVHSSQAPPATQTAASLPQRERGFAGALRTRGGRVPKRRRTTCVQDSTTSDDSESGLLIDEEEEEEEEAEEEAEESPVDLTGLDTEGICPAFLRRQLEKRGLTQRRPAASQDTQDAPPARLLNNPLRVLWEMPDREAAWPSVLFKDKKSAVAHIKSAHGGSGGEVVEDVRDLIDAYLREANERLLAAPWFDHTNEQHVHCLTTTRLAFWNRDARYNANCYNTILAAVRAVGPETDTTRFVAGGRDDAAAASDVESLVADDSSSSPRPAPPPRRRPAKRRRTPAGSARANKRRRRTRTARGSDSS